MKLFLSFKQRRSRKLIARVEACRPRLYRTAYSWSQDLAVADDLVQEALAKGLSKLHQLREPEALELWLFRILNSCWIDHIRKAVKVEELDYDLLINESTPLHRLEDDEVAKRLKSAMAELPIGFRQVITLVDVEEYSYIETSQILDIPIGTVMSRLARARNRLRAELSDCLGVESPEKKTSRLHRVK